MTDPGNVDPVLPVAPASPAYPDPFAAPAQPPAPGTDGFAVAALILGILGIALLALIFGVLALVRIGTSRRRGRGLAIAGLVLAGLWFFAFATVGTVLLVRQSGHAAAHSGAVDIADVRVGDCVLLDDLPAIVTQLTVVPCQVPHGGEVYLQQDLGMGGDWPGDAAVHSRAEDVCTSAFEPYVGLDIDSSTLDFKYFTPTQRGWSEGDRGLTCVADQLTGTITGGVKGSKR